MTHTTYKTNSVYKWSLIIASLAVVIVLAYGGLSIQNERAMRERANNAAYDFPQDFDKAADQAGDSNPNPKSGDRIRDTAY